MESGRDIILAVDSDLSDDLRDLASDLGVDMESQGTAVHDHFHRAAGAGPDIVTTSNLLQSKAVFGDRQPQVTQSAHSANRCLCMPLTPHASNTRPSTSICPLLQTHCQPWPPFMLSGHRTAGSSGPWCPFKPGARFICVLATAAGGRVQWCCRYHLTRQHHSELPEVTNELPACPGSLNAHPALSR